MNLTSLGINSGGRDYYGSAIPAGANFDIGAFESVPTYAGGAGNDTLHLRRDTGGTTELFANTPISASPTRVWAAGVYPTFSLSGGGGNDILQVTGTAVGDGYLVSPTMISRIGGDVFAFTDFDQLTLSNATFTADADLAGLALQVDADAHVNLNASQHLDGLVVAGTLDLKNNSIAVEYSAASPVGSWNGGLYDGITGMLAAGRIVSSAAISDVYGIAVAEASQVLGSSGGLFAGASVDGTAVLLKFTYAGDANLDGKLNILDYTQIDQGLAAGLTGWVNGDFNFDGKINILDYVLIDGALGNQTGTL
jgi:hypothetical protein